MFRFREIREIKPQEKLTDKGIDPDKLIDPVDDIIRQVQAAADAEWDKLVEEFDPDRLIMP